MKKIFFYSNVNETRYARETENSTNAALAAAIFVN